MAGRCGMRRGLAFGLFMVLVALAGATSTAAAVARSARPVPPSHSRVLLVAHKKKRKHKTSTTTTTNAKNGKASLSINGTYEGKTLSGSVNVFSAHCMQLGSQTFIVPLAGTIGTPTYQIGINIRAPGAG